MLPGQFVVRPSVIGIDARPHAASAHPEKLIEPTRTIVITTLQMSTTISKESVGTQTNLRRTAVRGAWDQQPSHKRLQDFAGLAELV